MDTKTQFLKEFPDYPDEQYDVVLVTGDAYVDHPSFGVAIIGRHLQSLGYNVGIIAQPDWKNVEDFKRFGKPRLFFGVTAGNLDSMVANYSPARQKRTKDSYSPGGKPGLRPDHASIVYSQRCREAFPDSVVVMGGVEASLRRFAHYDFVQQKVRGSALADAKADFLVYGMGERVIAQLAKGLDEDLPIDDMRKIKGLCYLAGEYPEGALILPAAEEVKKDTDKFFEAFTATWKAGLEAGPESGLEMAPPVIAQAHSSRWVVVNPPAEPLTQRELDTIYALPFTRRYPPHYDSFGGVPALEPVKNSLVTHRGCYGGCSFCALSAHQGRAIISRSENSLMDEARRLAKDPEFKGTINDVGGPTANMYGTSCAKAAWGKSGCKRPSCLIPDICPNLEAGGGKYLQLLRGLRKIGGVNHVFVASGIRHDLITHPSQRRLMRELILKHTGGQMKIAPEHVSNRTLRLMGKPGHGAYKEFVRLFDQIKGESEIELHLVPYLMVGHPGTSLDDSKDLLKFVRRLRHFVEQVQTFTPTPMTSSSCMYVTRRDPATGDKVYVPAAAEAAAQRAMVQMADPANRVKLAGYLKRTGNMALLKELNLDRELVKAKPKGTNRGTGRGAKKSNPFDSKRVSGDNRGRDDNRKPRSGHERREKNSQDERGSGRKPGRTGRTGKR